MELFAYLCALSKSIIYGTTVFFSGRLTESMDVLDLLALRFLLSFAVMWLLKITGVFKIKIGAKDFFVKNERSPYIRNVLLAALFEPVLYMLLETVGISETTGVTTAVILSMSPVLSVIFEMLLLRERCSLLQKVFLGCGIFGTVYIALNTSTTDGSNSVLGIVALFLAILSGTMFAVFSRKSSKKFAPMEITYISCMLGAVAFNLANVIRHIAVGDILHYFDPYFKAENIVGFLFLGVASTIIATAMNNYALSRLQISTMTAFGGVSTFVTVIVGVIFNSEVLEYFHYIGFFFILLRMVGVSVISIRRDRAKTVNTKR